MSTFLFVFLFCVGAVAIFVLGLSITLMVKGHFVDSEIATNKNMQKLGIRCAVQESRTDEQGVSCNDVGCSGNCAGCEIETEETVK
ncbi:MAG: hypothetical protein SNF93_00405 [Rikenellaceae bacterium]